MVQKHLVRSIKCSSEQLHFDRLHAACMHSACTHVKIEFLKYGFILMSVHSAHIILVFYNHQLTGVHAFFSPECVPPVKIVCSACNLKVQLMCDLPDPLPYAGFFMKRRKYNLILM